MDDITPVIRECLQEDKNSAMSIICATKLAQSGCKRKSEKELFATLKSNIENSRSVQQVRAWALLVFGVAACFGGLAFLLNALK